MGDPYDLRCKDCKERVSIGQKHNSGDKLYYSDKDTMETLRAFLFTHEWHSLQFIRFDVGFYIDDKEFDPTEYFEEEK